MLPDCSRFRGEPPAHGQSLGPIHRTVGYHVPLGCATAGEQAPQLSVQTKAVPNKCSPVQLPGLILILHLAGVGEVGSQAEECRRELHREILSWGDR